MLQPAQKKKFYLRLTEWYQENQRLMPWRGTRDPYRIWISEIMLQQTQVATVTDYYNRFVQQFPTVKALADSGIHDVLKAWEGMGYYARARNLHRAARDIVERYESRIPDNLNDLLSLPGIGEYTAGAILSIAYGKKAPVLDGNVVRVLVRLFHITDDVTKPESRRVLWQISEQILPDRNVGNFNQALMELGALVCRPKHPSCLKCPVRGFCEANRLSLQEELPVRRPKKKTPHYHVTAGIIWKHGYFLITLRPPKGLLGGLWEFPGGKQEPEEDLAACLKREIKEELDIEIEVRDYLLAVRHAYSHFRITLHVFHCDYVSGRIKCRACDDYKWIKPEDLGRFAFPAADRKVIAKLKTDSRGFQ